MDAKLRAALTEFFTEEFEADPLSQYFDYLPVLRRQRKELIEKQQYEPRIQRYRGAFRETQNVPAQIGTAVQG